MADPEDEDDRPIRPRLRRKRRGSGGGPILLKNGLLLAAGVYTSVQAIRLLGAPEAVATSARDRAYAFGGLLGGITSFWLGAVLCVVLIRSLLHGTYVGPRHKGKAFLLRFLLAFGLCFGGVAAVFVGSTADETSRGDARGGWARSGRPPPARESSGGDALLRAAGIALLLGGAVALAVALGQTRLTRRQRMNLLLGTGADEE